MVAFGHTAVGAIVGIYTYQHLGATDPITGLLVAGTVGVVSHYIADTIPHGHFFPEKEYRQKVGYAIVFDLFLSILVYLSSNILFTLFVLFGIGGSQLPDVVDGLIYTKRLPNKGLLKLEHSFHLATHWHGTKEKTLLWSIWDTWQIALFFFGLYLLLTVNR